MEKESLKIQQKASVNTHLLKCLSIVMPAYNEIYTIRQVLERVLSVPLPKELIIVDDGSTDGTREFLKALDAGSVQLPVKHDKKTSIKVIFQKKNQGKGAAIRTGVEHATGDLLIVQDADLEYDPYEYPRLVEPILSGDADVVYGSRFRGERRKVLFFWHTLGNKFLTLLSNIFTNLNLTDMETCYKVFKTEIIKSVPLRSNRFGFEPEITAKVAKLRCRIFEIPISYSGRNYAEGKKINWKDGVSALYNIVKFWAIDDLYTKTAGLRTLRIMEGAGKYNEWLFNQCKAHLGKRILEVGSGVGNITKFMLNRELVVATDVVDFYLQELKSTYQDYKNIEVKKLDLAEPAKAKEIAREYRPDTVLSLNVLEHIEDDTLALKNKNRALSADGKLIVLVPAHQFLFSAMDKNLGHMCRYSKKDLREKLEQAGFEVKSIRYLNMLGALGWFFNGKILRKKLIPSRQLRFFDLLIRLLSIEKIISPPFGLSVLAVAHKRKDPS